MTVKDLRELSAKEIIPGFWAKFVHSENVTVSYWEIEAGSSLPEHAHPHEQITTMIEGEFELSIEGELHRLKANTVAVIPSHAKHAGKAITNCKIIDVFYPVREDYRDGD
jgi:quercetin dioxygenase-like cupin family protein